MKQDSYTLGNLAEFAGSRLVGDARRVIFGINTLQDAGEGDLSFLASPAYARYLNTTKAAAVILAPDRVAEFCGNMLVLDNPYLGYAKVSHLFNPDKGLTAGVHSSAVVSTDTDIHSDVAIGPNVVIEGGVVIGSGVRIDAGVVIGHDTVIGRDTHLSRNVTICHGVAIGERVIIHPGAVIGSDGFGNARDKDKWCKIAQIGGVIIGDDVEVGSCTCIDRGALGDTVIGDGVRLDNLIQIAHNVIVGKNTAIAASVGISGSTRIGENCTIGGQAGFAGHIDIADSVHVGGMAMVTRSISHPGSYSSGTGLMKAREWRKSVVRFRKLDDLAKRLKRLENR
ncbi:MAG: UDP-3-O-(3-hydroxymyristoyl)glucosamine N-acyltransferase [Candidatus Endonucleobacter bathymodioli]|uniref:UDP-3-O-acylglucosamine N-acyltransferase n=1 Tax=Candidatus Endonucleibacter bathymodioli TaxID=539814 RepID=A0AA90NN18_9GAMM|nr:UDP-3-O-(3-hydroxymyristoyl)glucosamine N-acyltransferase [Candidatus Endonucleobacter bathymodioli]